MHCAELSSKHVADVLTFLAACEMLHFPIVETKFLPKVDRNGIEQSLRGDVDFFESNVVIHIGCTNCKCRATSAPRLFMVLRRERITNLQKLLIQSTNNIQFL